MELDGGRSGTEACAFHAATCLVLYPSDPYQRSRLGPHQRKDSPASRPLSLPRPLPASAQIARAAKPHETFNHSFRLLKTRTGGVCPQRVNKKQERATYICPLICPPWGSTWWFRSHSHVTSLQPLDLMVTQKIELFPTLETTAEDL